MIREIQLDGSIYDKTSIAIERIKTMASIVDQSYQIKQRR
jgi:hypothetical protein